MGRTEAKGYAIVCSPSVDMRVGLRLRVLSMVNEAALGVFVISHGHLP